MAKSEPPPIFTLPPPSDLPAAWAPTNAAELMFYHGAPLAHVVAFEDQRRDKLLRAKFRGRRSRLNPPAPLCGERL